MCFSANTAKECDIFKGTVTNFDYHHTVSAPLCHLKVLFQLNLSFDPLLRALCSAAKLCYFHDRQLILLTSFGLQCLSVATVLT